MWTLKKKHLRKKLYRKLEKILVQWQHSEKRYLWNRSQRPVLARYHGRLFLPLWMASHTRWAGTLIFLWLYIDVYATKRLDLYSAVCNFLTLCPTHKLMQNFCMVWNGIDSTSFFGTGHTCCAFHHISYIFMAQPHLQIHELRPQWH